MALREDENGQVVFHSIGGPLREVPALSRPHQDPTIRAWRLLEGSPAPGDSRLYLDRAALEYLLDNARASLTGRTVLHGVTVDVELRETPNGDRYQVLKFSGIVRPEGVGG